MDWGKKKSSTLLYLNKGMIVIGVLVKALLDENFACCSIHVHLICILMLIKNKIFLELNLNYNAYI